MSLILSHAKSVSLWHKKFCKFVECYTFLARIYVKYTKWTKISSMTTLDIAEQITDK